MEAKQIEDLRRQGYSEEEIGMAIEELEGDSLQRSYKEAQSQQRNDPRRLASSSHMGGSMPQNSIEWQVELDSIIERIEHLLKGDKPTFIDGSIIFIPAKSDSERVLNEMGVNEILRVVTAYVNRNTIFSNYSEETINWKVLDFGDRLSDLIFLKYDEYGLDTPQKRKQYEILVFEITDMVHSTYLRALNGMERDSLRKAISINEQIMPYMGSDGGMQMPQQRQERSMLNPMRYFSGKYK